MIRTRQMKLVDIDEFVNSTNKGEEVIIEVRDGVIVLINSKSYTVLLTNKDIESSVVDALRTLLSMRGAKVKVTK